MTLGSRGSKRNSNCPYPPVQDNLAILKIITLMTFHIQYLYLHTWASMLNHICILLIAHIF